MSAWNETWSENVRMFGRWRVQWKWSTLLWWQVYQFGRILSLSMSGGIQGQRRTLCWCWRMWNSKWKLSKILHQYQRSVGFLLILHNGDSMVTDYTVIHQVHSWHWCHRIISGSFKCHCGYGEKLLADGYSCQPFKEVAPKSNGQRKKLACDCVHGDCIGGKCKCSIGWSGSKCDQGIILNSS